MTMQNTRRPKVREFLEELVGIVGDLRAFRDHAWSIYNLEDLESQSAFTGFPVVGVAFEGIIPVDQSASTSTNFKSATAQTRACQIQAVGILQYRFSITVGIEYNPTGNRRGSDDTKAIATDLLDDVREAVLGFKGVNSRPWLLEGEGPTGSEVEGVIWYGQVWTTTVPVLSQHRN